MNEKPISPSRLNDLAQCRCFVHAPISSPAAQRGTKIDKVLREAWTAGKMDVPSAVGLPAKDIRAVTWAFNLLSDMAEDLASRDLIVTENKRLRITIDDIPGVTGGPMDAACFVAHWGLDLKTGKMRDYRPQMAAYSYGCMRLTGAARWKMYEAFADLEIKTSDEFTLDEARGVIVDIVNAPRVPRKCSICDRCMFKFNNQCEVVRS